MMNKDYYNYYEILFSLRKEYLKNQKIINELLSYIRIINDSYNDYDSNLLFKSNSKNNIDSLLLIVRKKQSNIEQMLDSLYSYIVYSDPNLKRGNFLYTFHFSCNKYVYLLDYNQDGRYLNAKVEIDNQEEFIKLYKQLIENTICKHGKTYIVTEEESILLSNNGIHLFHLVEDDYRKSIKSYYNGIEDNIIINNTSYLKELMELKINKKYIPNHFINIIDSNMNNYSYTIEENCNKNEELYIVEEYGKNLVLKPTKYTS